VPTNPQTAIGILVRCQEGKIFCVRFRKNCAKKSGKKVDASLNSDPNPGAGGGNFVRFPSGINKFVDGQSAISRILGGGNQNGNWNPEWSSQVSFRITLLERNSETIHGSDVHSDDGFGSDLFGNGL